MKSLAFLVETSAPSIRTRPPAALLTPASTSASSICPFPSTLAIPTTSPGYTDRDTPFKVMTLRSSSAFRSWAQSTGTLSLWSPRILSNSGGVTSSPTIILTMVDLSASFVSIWPVTLPLVRTVMRRLIFSTSSSLWLMKMTPFPSLVRLAMISNRPSHSWGRSTAVGSSKISTSAPVYRSFNISPFCCMPMLSCPTGL